MKPEHKNDENNHENYARTSQEVPFFPFRPASMAHIEMDEVERAQFEFVQQSGKPVSSPTTRPDEE